MTLQGRLEQAIQALRYIHIRTSLLSLTPQPHPVDCYARPEPAGAMSREAGSVPRKVYIGSIFRLETVTIVKVQ